jgi:2-dehydro-3-deoxyphosphogalactonate aldolase
MTLEDALDQCPLVAILRGVRPEEVVAMCDALHEAGIRAVEIPMNSPRPLESVAAVAQVFANRMAIGAGTVLSATGVDQVSAAGGVFVVSPNVDVHAISRAVQIGLTPMPGFATATEAFAALAAGALRLKLFPAATYGVGHMQALLSVLPDGTRIYPVGGVGPAQMEVWRAAGAAGFGVGSELYRPGQSAERTLEKARQCVAGLTAVTVG